MVRRRLVPLLLLVAVCAAVPLAGSGAQAAGEPRLPRTWGVSAPLATTSARMAQWRRAGLNRLIVPAATSAANRARLRARAGRARLLVIAPTHVTIPTPSRVARTARRLDASCRAARARSPKETCAVEVGRGLLLSRLAGTRFIDAVVVPIAIPEDLRLIPRPVTGGPRLIALAQLPNTAFSDRRWRAAISAARRIAGLDLAIAPRSGRWVRRFAGLIGAAALPSSANLWVDANGGSCARASSPGAYNDGSACGSFDAAYGAAQLGDVVLVKAGTYPMQTLKKKTNKGGTTTTPHVTFGPAPGERVTVYGIQLGTGSGGTGTDAARHVTLAGFQMPNDGSHNCQIWIRPSSWDVTVDGVSVCNYGIDASHTILIQNSTFGPCDASQSICMNSRNEGNGTTDVQIIANRFHDYTRQADSQHFECAVNWGATGSVGLVIRANRFQRCAVLDLALYQEGEALDPVLVENNFFELPLDIGQKRAPVGQAAINLKDANPDHFTDLTIRYNSFGSGTAVLWTTVGGGADVNTSATGNIFGNTNCFKSVRFAYNLYVGSSTCGGTGEGTISKLPYVNLSGGDFHLSGAPGSTPADNRVPTSAGCPADDIDGNPRPASGQNCDAGADER